VEVDVTIIDIDTEILMASYVENNTSQGKDWISDYDSTVRVCSQKEMFNSLVVREEGIVKIVDGSAFEAISTGIVNVTCKDGPMSALQAAQYASEARYYLISLGVLDEIGHQIKMQQGFITVCQEDKVILEGEKCGGIYKLKEGNSVRYRVSWISLKGSSSRGRASRKTVTRRESGQSVAGRRKGAFG